MKSPTGRNGYAERPEQTLVVSPDNRSRQEINERILTAALAAKLRSDPDSEYRVACNSRGTGEVVVRSGEQG